MDGRKEGNEAETVASDVYTPDLDRNERLGLIPEHAEVTEQDRIARGEGQNMNELNGPGGDNAQSGKQATKAAQDAKQK